MDCNCMDSLWPWLPEDIYTKSQYVSDFFIALAYFSIPCELIYFVKKSAVFPYKWVLVQFGAFIVLCGSTHAINMLTMTSHSRTVAFIMIMSKILTAIVSCATAVTLVTIIPDLLSVKTRELFLKNKADELDREMGLIRTQAEAVQHVRMLTHEIRFTLVRDTILNTTLVELGKALALEECALWMPSRDGLELHLCRTLGSTNPGRVTVPVHHPSIQPVFCTHRARNIPATSPVAAIRPRAGKYLPGEVVAVRVPLLHVENFNISYWPEGGDVPYALLVLMLPSDSARTWHLHELELVEAVAGQVAVALSHAAILEESIRQRDTLIAQNVKLDASKREAEMALRSRNDFLAVMDREMRTPMSTIIAASSHLQDTSLSQEQRAMVDTILNSSNLLATLINDVLDVSRLEDGSLELEKRTFNLPATFREVLNLVKPVASLRKLAISLCLGSELPEFVCGDDKRFVQIALNIVGNAVKFTKEGSVSITVRLEKPESFQASDYVVPSEKHCYIRVQVQDTGIGVNPQDIPKLFNKFIQAPAVSSRKQVGTGLGLAISKRLVSLMDGNIWFESEGLNRGCTVSYVVRLAIPDAVDQVSYALQQVPPSSSPRTSVTGLRVLVMDANGANRMVTRGLLLRLGCDAFAVGSPRECLQLLAQPGRSFRLVLVDVYMAESDGFEVAVKIQDMFKRHERPLVVALTAAHDRQTSERCSSIGMDGVIFKPISLEKMRSALAQLVDKGSFFDDCYPRKLSS
ncbi:ethylene response 1, two-component response regulator [Selaginella moellendorffii]|uniref:Ethylene receptor n=2 Tax=Selaginella moellendorffii TaxID=88036 RepID=D8S7K1_SELML|nr:hypothetical protein SELMODRAFT_131369 [Selaginella moellendorffii]EFJ19768.1 ethylene response 1, two-component response regulator [Selaginella moellendorffii]